MNVELLSTVSKQKVIDLEEKTRRIWLCNFCNAENDLRLEKEEMPNSTDVDYLERGTPSESQNSDDNSIIVFCIDTSGSMIVSSPIIAKDAKKLRKIKHELPTTNRGDAASQYLPNEKQGTTYISRLEAVQTAIEAQLINLQQEHPNRRVVLITFSNDATIYGDGTINPIILAGDFLNSSENLKNLSKWWPPAKSTLK